MVKPRKIARQMFMKTALKHEIIRQSSTIVKFNETDITYACAVINLQFNFFLLKSQFFYATSALSKKMYIKICTFDFRSW